MDDLAEEDHRGETRSAPRGRPQWRVIGSADDVAQDVCLAVINALPNYEIKGLSFRPFVYGIAAHEGAVAGGGGR